MKYGCCLALACKAREFTPIARAPWTLPIAISAGREGVRSSAANVFNVPPHASRTTTVIGARDFSRANDNAPDTTARALPKVNSVMLPSSRPLGPIAFVNAQNAPSPVDRLICLHRAPAGLFGVNQLDVDRRHGAPADHRGFRAAGDNAVVVRCAGQPENGTSWRR